MKNYISPYVSAYRKGYNSQHVLIRLLKKWRQHLDNKKVFGGVFTRSVNNKTGSILC